MNDAQTGLQRLQEASVEAFQSFLAALPYLAAGLLVLVLGWLLARLARQAAIKIGSASNSVLQRFSRKTSFSRHFYLSPALLTLIGNVVFWLVILIFIAIAAHVAQLELISGWIEKLTSYVPTLLVGGMIVLAGFLASTIARGVVTAAMESTGSHQGERFGLLAQAAVLITALVIGLGQIGIDVLFVTILFEILIAGILLSLALAFGMGASAFVGNLLGSNQIQRLITPGETVRIGDIEGQLVEFTPTAVIIATTEGRILVPGKRFQEEATLIVTADPNE